MTQPTLFDPKKTEKPVCPSCGTTAKNLCKHDADVRHDLTLASSRRPRGCLAAYDPHTAPFPEGF